MTRDALTDPVLDEEWLATPKRRSRTRLVLVGLLAASVCFLGGALAQRHFGSTSAATSGLGPSAGLPSGMPSGFPGGSGGFPGAGQSGAAASEEATGGSGAAGGSGAGGGADAVIGAVVRIRGGTWIVEDLGGKRHVITVSSATEVVRERRLTTEQVKTGQTVNITGTPSGGRLAADHVTLR